MFDYSLRHLAVGRCVARFFGSDLTQALVAPPPEWGPDAQKVWSVRPLSEVWKGFRLLRHRVSILTITVRISTERETKEVRVLALGIVLIVIALFSPLSAPTFVIWLHRHQGTRLLDGRA